MPSPSFTNLCRDIEGGIVSAAVAIPLSVAFGMFAFVSLGDDYFVHGAIAGFIASFVASALGIAMGQRNRVTIYAPRITTTFFLGALLYGLAHVEGEPTPVGETLLVLFSIILLGGLFQALFGVVRLGTLIKFTPHPVTAGFQNMAAILLFVVQFANVLGYSHNVKFTQVQHYFSEARPMVLAIAALTFVAMWNAKRITTAIPPLVFGIAVGTAAYYGVKLAGYGDLLGPVIGLPSTNVAIPKLIFALDDRGFMTALPGYASVIVPGALALALIAAIDAMLCAKLASAPTDAREDSNRLLVRLGLTNAVIAASGGITAGINIGATVTNRAFGGHSWVSVAVNAALQLAVILYAMPYVAYLPRSVLSAVIMVVAVQHIDPWSKDATGRFFAAPKARWKSLGLDLLVALIVSVLSIAINIVAAVFLGVALAVALFVLRMSRSNVRRLYHCDAARSRKARGSAELAALEAKGRAVVVIELQGALFFGSAEHLAQVIEQEAIAAKFVILDLRRVTEIELDGRAHLHGCGGCIGALRLQACAGAAPQQRGRARPARRAGQALPRHRPGHRMGGRQIAERRHGSGSTAGTADRGSLAAARLFHRPDAAAAALFDPRGLAGGQRHDCGRRSRLASVPGDARARQRPPHGGGPQYPPRDLRPRFSVRRTGPARPWPALRHGHRRR